MKRLLLAMLAMCLVPSLAFAAEEKTAATPADDPMAGWVPPKVKNEVKDKKEITALFQAMETAAKSGDLEAAAALVDFPVMMMTDDSKGEAMGEPWSREQWVEVMEPFYAKPQKDMKVKHKPTIFLISDSLASVDDVCTMTMGGKTMTSRNSMFLVRREGKWRVKGMAEGGWGDMMAQRPHGTASSAPDSASGSQGAQGAPSGTGAAEPSPTRTDTPSDHGQERTTK